MSERASATNPRVLRWARERAGLSIDEVAAKLKKPPAAVAAWESGEEAPTFRQLEHLADTLYKRPVALFFFPDPPTEADPKAEFRTLPNSEFEGLESDTRFAVREALSFRESIRDLTEGRNPAERQILLDIQADVKRPIDATADAVRSYLNVPLSRQFSWANAADAFKNWRRAVEAVGIFIFKRSFKQRGISGFCLYDRSFPIIVINNSTAHSRQTFTLAHELGHLLFEVGGITKDDIRYFERLSGSDREIEIASSHFASEFLVPEASFPWHEFQGVQIDPAVARFADKYRVSREVILRRLLDRGLVNRSTYEARVASWNKEYYEARTLQAAGGDYYATRAAYLGETFLRLAFGQYHAGRLSLQDLADHLRMKARNIARFEDFLVGNR